MVVTKDKYIPKFNTLESVKHFAVENSYSVVVAEELEVPKQFTVTTSAGVEETRQQNRGFLAFKTPEDLYNYIIDCPTTNKHLHEVVLNNRGKLAFDFDISFDKCKTLPTTFFSDIETLITDCLVANVKNINMDYVGCFNFIWLECSNTKKFSFHLIVENLILNGWVECSKFIYQKVSDLIASSSKFTWISASDLIDIPWPKKNATLRTAYSSKIGGQRLVFSDANNCSMDWYGSDYCCQFISSLINTFGQYPSGFNTTEVGVYDCIGYSVIPKNAPCLEITDAMFVFASEKFNASPLSKDYEIDSYDNGLITLKRLHSSNCCVCNRFHDSVGACLKIFDNDTIYFYCPRNANHDRFLVYSKNNYSVFYDELYNIKSSKTEDHQYLPVDVFNDFLASDHKTLLLKSNMGTGKTTSLLNSDFFTPESNVLIITSTQQLTHKWFLSVKNKVDKFIDEPLEKCISDYLTEKIAINTQTHDNFLSSNSHSSELKSRILNLYTPDELSYYPNIDPVYYKQLRPTASKIQLRIPKLTTDLENELNSPFPDISKINDLKSKIKIFSCLYPRDLYSPLKVVTTPESLHHVFQHRENWDFIVIDEANLVLQNFTCATMHNKISSSFHCLQNIVKSCSKLIVMDHSLNSSTIDTFKQLSHTDAIPTSFTYVNTGGKFDGIADVYSTRTEVSNKLLNCTEPFVIVSNSRRIIDEQCAKITARSPAKRILKFVGVREEDFYDDVTDTVKRDMYIEAIDSHLKTSRLISINENNPDFWNQFDVFAYSPSITVGVDFQVDRFKHVFGFFTAKSCNYETCLQMLRRFRKITSFTLQFPTCFDVPFKPENIRAKLNANPRRIPDYLKLPDSFLSTKQDTLDLLYPLLINNFIFDKYSSTFFSSCLTQRLKDAGFKVFSHKKPDAIKDDPITCYVPCWESKDEKLNEFIKHYSMKFGNLHPHLVKTFIEDNSNPFIIKYTNDYPILGRIFTNIYFITKFLNRYSNFNTDIPITEFKYLSIEVIDRINTDIDNPDIHKHFQQHSDYSTIYDYLEKYGYATYSDIINATSVLIKGSYSPHFIQNIKTIFSFLLLNHEEDPTLKKYGFKFNSDPTSISLIKNFYIDPSIKPHLTVLPILKLPDVIVKSTIGSGSKLYVGRKRNVSSLKRKS